MPLDISKIIPQKGQMFCVLLENDSIGMPLQLFYFIEIPLKEFDTGHEYVEQPSKTTFAIDFIRFLDNQKRQERNWKNLAHKDFLLSYEEDTAEGCVYLGSEHCQFDSHLSFSSLREGIFDIELSVAIDFNIETINLNKDGLVKIRTQIEFEGLKLYPPEMLPSFKDVYDPISIIREYIDLAVFQNKLKPYKVHDSEWMQLEPAF